jgi:glycosyltransferase involved in cell wall biosynthesis
MVIHLITRLALGGAQQQVIQITTDLTNNNKDTLIITGLSDSTSLSAKDNKLLELGFLKKIKIEVVKELSDRISISNDIISIIKIFKLLKKYEPNVIHIHSSKTGVLGRLMKVFFREIKIIYHVHGWSFSRSNGLKAKLIFFIEKCLYNFTDKYIFVCKQDMIDFIKKGGNKNIMNKSEIIYPGTEFIDKSKINQHRTQLRKKLGLDKDDLVIGTIGRVDFQKNPEKFLEIAKIFISYNNKAKFLWIGKGSLQQKVLDIINKYGLNNHIIFTGFVEEIEPYFSLFDIFVLTSRYEGLPITIIKALSLEIPVVSYNINGVNDLTKKYKSVFGATPFKIDSFINKLKDCELYVK